MALQELVRAGTVHAIWVAKGGCWLHLLHPHLILLWVNLALVLWAYVQVLEPDTSRLTGEGSTVGKKSRYL